MSNVRMLREHGTPSEPDSCENRLRMRGFWPIVETVCAKHYLLPSEVLPKLPRYRREVMMCRWELFTRILDMTNYGLPGVARLFHVDHTTVMYGVKMWRQRNGQTPPTP